MYPFEGSGRPHCPRSFSSSVFSCFSFLVCVCVKKNQTPDSGLTQNSEAPTAGSKSVQPDNQERQNGKSKQTSKHAPEQSVGAACGKTPLQLFNICKTHPKTNLKQRLFDYASPWARSIQPSIYVRSASDISTAVWSL